MGEPRATQRACPEAAEPERREARIERGLRAFLEIARTTHLHSRARGATPADIG
jgi:hypothetical protein